MYNTKFVLSTNQEVYPGYLDKEHREELKEQYSNKREFMWCGCRQDKKLFYRISEDLKIYPEHKNYEHDKCCSRYRTESGEAERQIAYVINEEDGQVTAYLSFNPKNFNMNNDSETEQDNPSIPEEDSEVAESELILEKDEEAPAKKTEKKEPQLSMPSLIRSINIDTFTEKSLNNRKIDSRENFSKYVYHRMKRIRVSRMKKAIGELTLETDGVRFFYLPFGGIVKKEDKCLTKCYVQSIGPDGRIYNNFIFPDTLKKAIKEFTKTYGIGPTEDTMMAGFQYYKKSRSKSMYKVFGRLHLFQISQVGIYCRDLVEKETYDTLSGIIEKDRNLKFWIPPEDDNIGGVIQVTGKEKKLLVLFRGREDERITFDNSVYEPLVIGANEPVTEERLYNIIEKLE